MHRLLLHHVDQRVHFLIRPIDGVVVGMAVVHEDRNLARSIIRGRTVVGVVHRKKGIFGSKTVCESYYGLKRENWT